jgi:hypothetical protein
MSGLAGLWRTHRGAVMVVSGVAAALVIAGAFIWPITDLIAAHDVGRIIGPQRATQLQTAREAVRTQLLTLAAGVFVAGALWFTAQNFRLSRQGQVTDRYTKAIGQLGEATIDVRIGAIYALQRIARDSARDHPTVMEVLAAFIREHSHEEWRLEPDRPPEDGTRPDVQAAVTVIGRANRRNDRQPVDLTRVHLPEADLTGADLTGAKFITAQLWRLILNDAILRDANLTNANLLEADLTGADLTGANLTDARFSEGMPVPEGWVRDPDSGRLRRARADAGDSGN